VKNVRDQNMALLGKWIWKAINESDLDRVKILKANIFNRRKLERLDGGPIMGSSAFEKGIWKYSESFNCDVIFNCGSGKNIKFWLDVWIGNASLAATYLFLFDLAVNKEGSVFSQYSIIK